MVNTRNKMYDTNAKIREYLKSQGFHSLYFFPHTRFLKDYCFEDCGFDALGWKDDDKHLWLFQCKTNMPCPKSELERYEKIKKKYFCKPCWISVFDSRNKILKYKGVKIVSWS